MSKYYFQVILEDTKETENKYIDKIKELLNGVSDKKELLFKLIDNLETVKEDDSKYDTIIENMDTKHKDMIEEIKDLKLMIKGLNTEGVKIIKEDEHEKTLGIDTNINKSELNGLGL